MSRQTQIAPRGNYERRSQPRTLKADLARLMKDPFGRLGAFACGSMAVGAAVAAVILPGGGGENKIKFDNGNVVNVDKKDQSTEVDTKALGITNPGEETAREAGVAITVKCIHFHPAATTLEMGDTLTELAISETSVADPQIPVSALTDSIAAYDNITAPDGNVDGNFAQEGAIYNVPQFCMIED